MAIQNNITFSLTEEQKTEVEAAINTLKTVLLPHLQTLTANERQEITKMGDKSVAFVEKAYAYSQEQPDLVPAYVDTNEMKVDLDAFDQLRSYKIQLDQLLESLDDSMMLAGSDAIVSALSIYSAFKMAAGNNMPGAEPAYEDMKARFPGRKGY